MSLCGLRILPSHRPRPRFAGAVLAGLLAVSAAAAIPDKDAYDLYLQTEPAHRELSPFWGMAALKTGVLANVRFFGGYGNVEHKEFPAHPSLKTPYNFPQDAISSVIQWLFPSPDGRHLIPNERDKDPIGLIAREQSQLRQDRAGDHPGATGLAHSARPAGLRKILALLDASEDYRKKLALPSHHAEAAAAFREAIHRILEPAKKIKGKTSFNDLSLVFANMMQQAMLEETRDRGNRYPPRIVETALLAYAWLTADEPAELRAGLRELFRPEGSHARSGPGSGQDGLSPDPMSTFTARLEAAARGTAPAPDAAETFDFLLASKHASSPTPEFLPMGHAHWDGKTFPDCGETSLRNFLLAMLWAGGDRLEPQRLADLQGRFGAETKDADLGPAQARFERILRFFQAHPTLSAQGTHARRDEWAALVSGVNREADEPLPVPYRDAGSCNLAGEGVEAMLNLVAHLLPDPGLNAPWPGPGPGRAEAVVRKLDRLCELFSRDGARLDWRVNGGKQDVGRLADLDFSRETVPLLTWQFRDRHYDLESRHLAPGTSLFETLAKMSTDYWVQAIIRPGILNPATGRSVLRIRSFRDHFMYSHDGVAAVDLFMETIDHMGLGMGHERWDLYSNLVYRGFPRNAAAFTGMAAYYAVIPDPAFHPLPGLRDLPQEDRNRLLAESLGAFRSDLTRMLIDHGAQANAKDARGTPMVLLVDAWSSPDYGDKLEALAAAGADLDARDARGRGLLHAAVEKGNPVAVAFLLGKGLDPLAKDLEGRTPLDIARKGPGPNPCLVLLERAMDVERKAASSPATEPPPL